MVNLNRDKDTKKNNPCKLVLLEQMDEGLTVHWHTKAIECHNILRTLKP